MREMASLASGYGRLQLPASLMQRLELMQQLALATQPNSKIQRRSRGPRRGAHAIVLAWFSLGVLASGALGAGTIVAMRAQAAGATPLASIASLASMYWAAWAKAPPAPATATQDAAWDTVQVAMGRAERVPLPLQVTGTDGAAFELVIGGLPAGVRPSRGAPRGPAWVLGPDDLEGLFLTLDDTAPAAFDVRIALAAPAPVAVASPGSIVQVRLSDLPEQRHAATTDGQEAPRAGPPGPGDPDGGQAELAWSGQSPKSDVAHRGRSESGATPLAPSAGDTAKAAHEAADPVPRRATADATAGAETAGRRPWPEGASALGAVSREPDAPSWWQMPPPSWSPFVVGQERP